MRYELKNLGPGAFYCVEAAKLLKQGESVNLNQIDEGTRRLSEGPNKRLEIIDRRSLPAPTAAPPASTSAGGKSEPSAPSGQKAPVTNDAPLAADAPNASASDAPKPPAKVGPAPDPQLGAPAPSAGETK
jgi:hypothetical protein